MLARGRNGWDWQRTRLRIRARDKGLCQPCLKNGFFRPGSECDHIVELRDGGSDADSNLQWICRECHDHKTHRRELPKGCDALGNPLR